MRRWVLIAPLLLFGLTGIYLLVFFLRPGGSGPFHENLLPELIGFCLEGFFLVGILSYIQQTREHERRQEMWLSLRGSLRDFLSHLDVAYIEGEGEPEAAKALEEDPEVVIRLHRQLDTVELDLESMIALKNVGERSLELTHDLIPVAAQLSAGHMRWWIAIVDSVRHLSEAEDRYQIYTALRSFLANLSEFDALGY